jgi:hypothetical protein
MNEIHIAMANATLQSGKAGLVVEDPSIMKSKYVISLLQGTVV